jgi:N-succinyldiaminopimelate aminotransferase
MRETMNPDLDRLHPYPFEKLAQLKAGIEPPRDRAHIALSIGEPKHPAPAFVEQAVAAHLGGVSLYPSTRGAPELRSAIADWLRGRFRLQGIDPESQILPVNGTREALFAFAQAVIDRTSDPLVLMPNPFYQIYEGAAILAGAQPYYLNTVEASGLRPDFTAVPEQVWQRCQLVYVCSPGNPTGAVIDRDAYAHLIALADEHDFLIAADECYAELYPPAGPAPPGLLQICAELGRTDYQRCVVFHSLSKRSSLPGLRSGFVAGDAGVIERFLLYRTYHGCAMPLHHQAASMRAWRDEAHVAENRRLYQRKFDAVLEILAPVLTVSRPAAGFYLWPSTPVDDTRFARELFAEERVSVLPGTFLARDTAQGNPGRNRCRMALVAPLDECIEAARRIRRYVESL